MFQLTHSHTHTHTHTCTLMHSHWHAYTHAHTHMHTDALTLTCTHTHTHYLHTLIPKTLKSDLCRASASCYAFLHRVICIFAALMGPTPVNRYPYFHIYSTFCFKPCNLPIWPILTLGCSWSRMHWFIDLVSSIRKDSWMPWFIHLTPIGNLVT